MRLVAAKRPVIDCRGHAGASIPLETLRDKFRDGAAQVIFLAISELPVEPLARPLSEDERSRLNRIHSRDAARRFIACRWLLRSVLAIIAGGAPEKVRLEYGRHGKPMLVEPSAGEVAFNLSHSGDLVALALLRGRRIGIDIERTRPLSDVSRLAARILTAGEAAGFTALPADERSPMLIAAWTRKEAVLKALGTGISGSLNLVEVLPNPIPGGVDFLAVVSGAVPERWLVQTLELPAGFQGALATEEPNRTLAIWQAFPVTPNR